MNDPRWFNALNEEVDLDDIDREYALNILTHILTRFPRNAMSPDELRADPLVQKLRDVILNGRDKSVRDRKRAARYNFLNKVRGLPWRA